MATVALEVAVAALLGYCRRVEIAAVVCVNVFTNPLVNYLVCVVESGRAMPIDLAGISLFEAAVVMVEWQLLRYALPQRPGVPLLGLSLAMNSVSYLAGVLLPIWV